MDTHKGVQPHSGMAMEHYSSVKRGESLTQATQVSEISQMPKASVSYDSISVKCLKQANPHREEGA